MTLWTMTCKRTSETDTVVTCDKCSEQMPPLDGWLTADTDTDDDIACDFCPTPTHTHGETSCHTRQLNITTARLQPTPSWSR